MNPALKYWVNNFFLDIKTKTEKYKNISNAELYQLIAETGILYGVPVKTIIYEKNKYSEWNNIELFKVIYLETLTIISINKYKLTDTLHIINKIYKFITSINKQKTQNDNKTIIIENYINNLFEQKDIKLKIINQYNFNFIFIDFYLYFKYTNNYDINKINNLKIQTTKTLLQLINYFINIDNDISKNEKNIYNYYLESAKNYTNTINYNQIKTNNKIDYKFVDNYFLKRLVLDIAIIIFLEDNNIDKQEKEILNNIIQTLKIEKIKLEQSIIFIENFILENSKKIFYLNNKKLSYITQSLSERLLKLIIKNKNMIISEIRESGELLILIQKSLKTELTQDEKQKINKQIKDIIKSIPALTIFMIPGGSILLPLILKILPHDLVYPSSFKNKKNNNL